MFVTVPGSSINSWDSWFIFNLPKNKHLLLHDIFHDIFVYGKGLKEDACCYEKVNMYIGNVASVVFWDVNYECFQLGWQLVEIPLYILHVIWVMYILGLCSSWGTSRICPSWSPSEHLLAPALSPFGGARVRSHAIQRRLFIVLMTAAHISPNVFSLREFLSNIQRLFLTVQAISFIPIIHHIYTHMYIFYFVCLVHIFTSSDLHGRLAALGSLCPIQVNPLTNLPLT